ncbi:MAG: polysaccharide deacetylase family protein [Clostridia bacterium]
MNSSKITLLLTQKNILITILLLILILSIITLTYLYKNPKIPVLCYHNIATQNEKANYPEESDWTITTDNFKEHLDYLKNNNYKTLTMDEFYNWKIGNLNLPYKSVLITFDGGFLSNYEYAFKLLKEYNMNATVFVVGSFIDNSTTNEWNGNIKTYMTKDILENLKNEYPNIEIYSHSYNLHYQGAINQNKDVLMQDIENFDNFYPNNDILCYPFGQYNDNIEDCLKESNYKMAFRYGPNKKDYKKASRNDNIYEIPRLNVSHGMSVFKFALRLFMYN